MGMFRRSANAALLFCLIAGFGSVAHATEVVWQPIEAFDLSEPGKTRFGALTFLRGGVLTADHSEFGGFSGLHMEAQGEALLAITDRGQWLRARLPRNADGDVRQRFEGTLTDITDARGQVARRKQDKDAEGLAVAGDVAFVSFERLDRVVQYALPPNGSPSAMRVVDYPFPGHELRRNEGLEALALAPESAGLGRQTLVAVSEGSINRAGDLFAFVMSGPQRGTFFVKARDDFNVTDADFLPDGNLLLLERRFSFGRGLGVRIREVDSADIRPGQTVDGTVIFQASLAQTIDNMEGMSVWQDASGQTMVSLISDDNLSFLQQTVYLEFRFDGE